MPSPAIATLVKMMESVPEPLQSEVVERVREFLEDLRDELRWNETFKRTDAGLAEAARRAKQEIATGQAKPFDPDQL